jgi:hypothetical protein
MRATIALFVFVQCIGPTASSSLVSADDAEALRLEALAELAPGRIHGQFDYMLSDPDSNVDATDAAGNWNTGDDCANVPVRAKRSDGKIVMTRVNVCD